jgi:hypothetical protein
MAYPMGSRLAGLVGGVEDTMVRVEGRSEPRTGTP